MTKWFRRFVTREKGAVTVDWVVLTAAIVGLTVMIASAMQDEAVAGSDAIASYMSGWTFE